MIFDLNNENDVYALEKAYKPNHIIGLTSGSFDLFHDLHLVYLQRCRRLCDVLIVGVDSNDLVATRKGNGRPLVSEHKRVFIVSALNCVNAAFIMGSVQDFEKAVNALNVNLIFKNDTFKESEVLGGNKAKVVLIPDIKQHSSTTDLIAEIMSKRKSRRK